MTKVLSNEPREGAQIMVRELGLSDVELLMNWRMEVLEEVFADSRPWDREAAQAANRAYYERHLGVDHVACIVSVDGEDAACGAMCLQEEMPSPDNPSGRCAYLMNIYTRPAFRRKGAAAEAVRWLIAKAQELGADKIYLEATDMGAPLYAKLGFRPMHGMMRYEEGLER